ncbi:MAG TPA: acylphosphatase [Rhizomicrobium sp.]|jgi:acylphosphatase|nr:acylphosphatase [Rhizomicrobium sp.]
MSDDDLTTLRVRVEGFVQAVGFRNFAVLEARKLGLDGWVRNRSDRTVEALVSGSTKAVESFVAACMKGPQGALVKNIDLFKEDPPAEKGFHQRPTL